MDLKASRRNTKGFPPVCAFAGAGVRHRWPALAGEHHSWVASVIMSAQVLDRLEPIGRSIGFAAAYCSRGSRRRLLGETCSTRATSAPAHIVSVPAVMVLGRGDRTGDVKQPTVWSREAIGGHDVPNGDPRRPTAEQVCGHWHRRAREGRPSRAERPRNGGSVRRRGDRSDRAPVSESAELSSPQNQSAIPAW